MRSFPLPALLCGLVSAAGWSPAAGAQHAPPSPLPVLEPRITVVGEVRDSTVDGAFLPIDAAVSPNGRLIAYSTREDLRMISAESPTPRVIFNGTVHTFLWNDKGNAITLTYDDPRGRTILGRTRVQPWSRDIYVLHVDPSSGIPTGPAVKAADGPVNHAVMLSPDESLVAYPRPVWDSTRNAWSDTRADLAVAPASGGPIRTLATAQDLRVRGWSLDSRTVYFHGFPDSLGKRDELRSIPVTGGTSTSLGEADNAAWPNHTDPMTHRVTATFDVPQGISVSDWSSRDAIAGVRLTRPRGLRIINLEDGSTRDLAGPDGEVGIPDWFSGGSRLAFIERRAGRLSLVTMNVDGSARHAYTFATPPRFDGVGPDDAHLHVSPDGNYAAFLGESSETLELLDLRTGAQRRLVKVQADAMAPEGIGLGQLSWSADSKSIRYVYGQWDPRRRAVREVTLGGADRLLSPLSDSTGAFANVYFAANAGGLRGRSEQVVVLGGQRIVLVPFDGGSPRIIYRGRILAYSGSLSPDGHTFAVREVGDQAQHHVRLISVDDGHSRVLTHSFIRVSGTPVQAQESIAWQPHGKRLLIMGRLTPGGPVSLYSVPIDGGAPRAIAPVGSNRDESVIVLSPDGRRVAVTVGGVPRATFLRLDYDVTSKSLRR